MNSDIYKMSFTTGGLFLKESVQLAELYLHLHDWKAVKDKVQAGNILQTRKQSTSQRVYREITHRLEVLDKEEMEFLLHCTTRDQAFLLWAATCRYYKFISDFAVEVLHERYVTHKKFIKNEDFDLFFSDKEEWHPELERIKPSTRLKLRSVLFRIMRDAELLSEEKKIIPSIISIELLAILSRNNYGDLMMFPVLESVIEGRAL